MSILAGAVGLWAAVFRSKRAAKVYMLWSAAAVVLVVSGALEERLPEKKYGVKRSPTDISIWFDIIPFLIGMYFFKVWPLILHPPPRGTGPPVEPGIVLTSACRACSSCLMSDSVQQAVSLLSVLFLSALGTTWSEFGQTITPRYGGETIFPKAGTHRRCVYS